ncbi:MAG: type II toxin-antitoxin system RelE/ParE family toxin [Alphaproteobacteria bacterium]|nr:type II toxin-antitoxin system RelE/ParE family toxin [Alphaproteobacteria bacterium]
MKWNIIIHPDAVTELNQLPPDMKAKLTRLLELIQQVGPLGLREPHVKNLGNKLWEIRLSGRDGISRVIYGVFSQKKLGLLHAFIKKTQKTPKQAIECALKRLKEI